MSKRPESWVEFRERITKEDPRAYDHVSPQDIEIMRELEAELDKGEREKEESRGD